MINPLRPGENIRSLLSSETLEDNLGIRVYAKVLDGLSVGRAGRGCVSPALRGSSIAKGRSGVTAEGLHDGWRGKETRGEEIKEKRGEGRRARRRCKEAAVVGKLEGREKNSRSNAPDRFALGNFGTKL